MLQDAYLDFYLFIDLLTKVDLKTSLFDPEHLIFEGCYGEAEANTEILEVANRFVKLKK